MLRAAQDFQDSDAPGFPAGSLPLSRAAAIQRQQKQLKAASEYTSWDLDDDDAEDNSYDKNNMSDDTDYDTDDADYDVTLRQRQHWQRRGAVLGEPPRLTGSSGSSGRRLLGGSSSSSGWALTPQQRGYRHERRVPDLLEYLECTKPLEAAGGSDGDRNGSSSSNSSERRGLPLNLPLDR